MLDPQDLYTVDPQTAEVLSEHVRVGRGPVLLHMVRGFVDAGAAGRAAAEHLIDTLGADRLVTFDVDQLLDYRSRRPLMTFDATRWTEYDQPQLVVDLLRDREGVPFLLLHGSEPDVQWERYVAAVRQVVERFDVPLSIGVHGIPMGVPHTRPLGVTAHGTRSDLLPELPAWFGTVQVPASSSALLELRLGQTGHDAIGFAVHVPHYLVQSTFPQASVVALTEIERQTGLELGVGELEASAQEALAEVERQVTESEEVRAVVAALEEQYDSFARAVGRTSLLAEASEIPTAEELGAQFEQFLAEHAADDDA